MDLEGLTKHQIILLTLLVSFVTSIATGIVTVSLMNQAPPEVTRTINQIVEHTIERVVPAAVQMPSQSASVITKETTVVVKDDDLVAQSIGKMQKAMVRIVSKNDPDTLVARGVIVDSKGTTLSDRASLEAMGTLNFEAILPSGARVPAMMHIPSATSSIAVLDLAVGTSTGFAPATLAVQSKLQLGQTLVRIGGTGADTVGTGVIAKLPETHSTLLEASVSSATPGSVLMTLFGEVVGIITGDSAAMGSDFYSIPQL